MSEKIKFTPDEIIESFTPGLNVEIIGFVDAIEATKLYGQKRIFKFLLNNGQKYRLQINAFDDEIKRTEEEVKLGNIIHLKNAKANSDNKFNKGNFRGAQLSIQKFTIIENIGTVDLNKFDNLPEDTQEQLNTLPLEAIGDSILPLKFKTSGYIKTKFSVIKSNNEEWNKAFFSITDGHFKMEVTINAYKENEFQKGDHIEITGSILKLKSDEITFIVDKMQDVVKLDEDKKPLNWLLNGRTTIYSSAYSSGTSKKQKIQ